jgi:hypothetical protein
MIFQAISNAPTSKIQIITFLHSKNFPTLHGGINSKWNKFPFGQELKFQMDFELQILGQHTV